MKFSCCDKMVLIQTVFVFLLCFMKSSCIMAKKDYKCGFPGQPAFGEISENEASYQTGDVVHYGCYVGYILLGSPISRCREDGSWSEEAPICDDSMTTLISASSSPFVPGYPAELAIDKNKQTCTYLHPKKPRFWRIDLGGDRLYKVLTVALTMKTQEKNLKFTVFVVVEVKGILSDAHYRRCASFSGRFGTPTIILSCAEGKGVEGTKVHIEDHNPLDGLFELCEVEVQVQKDTGYDCGLPSRNLHSIVKKISTNLVQYDCLKGYRIKGNEYRSCLKTGQWSDKPPICEPIICDELEPLENGNITFHNGNSSPVLEGAIAAYKCYLGYKLTGAFTRTCLEDGSWSEKPPKCKAIRCPIPEGTHVGGVYRLINKTNNMGSMALLRCKGGKIEGENPYITCTENGVWTEAEAACVIPAKASSEKLKPPRIVNQGGIIFGMVVAAVMIVAVLVGLYLYGQKRRNNPEIPSRLIEPLTPPPRPPPRVKQNSLRTSIKGFLNRESTDAEPWKTRSLPSNKAEETSPGKVHGGSFSSGNVIDTVVEVLNPDHSKAGTAQGKSVEEVAVEMEEEESVNDSSKIPGPDYSTVDYEKKRQSRILKEQESTESSSSTAASPLPDDESDMKLTSHSPIPPKRISESEDGEDEEEEDEESEASIKLNVADNEDSQKELRSKEEEEREAKEKEEKEAAEKNKKVEEEEKMKQSAASIPGSRRRRINYEPSTPADADKPLLRRFR